ncbi:nitroreductase family protein [Aeromicrobium sp.]
MPSSTDLYDVINRRRDVRAEFSGEPIDSSALKRVLAAAHAAPSVGHTQPWDFVLVGESGLGLVVTYDAGRGGQHVLERRVAVSGLGHRTPSRA